MTNKLKREDIIEKFDKNIYNGSPLIKDVLSEGSFLSHQMDIIIIINMLHFQIHHQKYFYRIVMVN